MEKKIKKVIVQVSCPDCGTESFRYTYGSNPLNHLKENVIEEAVCQVCGYNMIQYWEKDNN